jgi:hypothetical protein
MPIPPPEQPLVHSPVPPVEGTDASDSVILGSSATYFVPSGPTADGKDRPQSQLMGKILQR